MGDSVRPSSQSGRNAWSGTGTRGDSEFCNRDELIAQDDLDRERNTKKGCWHKFSTCFGGEYTNHSAIIKKNLQHHSFSIVVREASTPPTPPLAWPTSSSSHYPRQKTRVSKSITNSLNSSVDAIFTTKYETWFDLQWRWAAHETGICVRRTAPH